MEHEIGEFTKKASASYRQHIVSREKRTRISSSAQQNKEKWEKYVTAFCELGLMHANEAQVCQICQDVFKEDKSISDNEHSLTYSEFCVLGCELLTSEHLINDQTDFNMSRHYSQFILPEKGVIRNNHHSSHHQFIHEVFLGGSCNPTVWRREVCIPLLQEEGITYYNPQVDKWTPELVDIEEQAKCHATVLLFVIDNQTRAVSSMVEVAYLIGRGDPVVIVINDFEQDGPVIIAEEMIKQLEIDDLRKSRQIIKQMVVTHNVLMESTVKEGTKIVVKLIKRLFTAKELIEKFRENKMANITHVSTLIKKLHYIFSMYDNSRRGRLSTKEACLALCSLNVLTHPFPTSFSSIFPDTPVNWEGEQGLNFDDFCILYSELKYSLLRVEEKTKKRWTWSSISECLWSPFVHLLSPGYPTTVSSTINECKYDLYLGGTDGSWRRDISIPLLVQYGVSYYNPQSHRDSFTAEECSRRECNVLLFVITGDMSGISSLIEVAYCIGERKTPVVLCIEELNIGYGQLTQRAIKDYNRGRTYLTNIANKNRIPVHTNISQATLCCISIILQGEQKGRTISPLINTQPLLSTSTLTENTTPSTITMQS